MYGRHHYAQRTQRSLSVDDGKTSIFYRSVIWSNPSQIKASSGSQAYNVQIVRLRFLLPTIRLYDWIYMPAGIESQNSLGDGSMPVIAMEEFTSMEPSETKDGHQGTG